MTDNRHGVAPLRTGVWHSRPAADALGAWAVDPQTGLSAEEAGRRLARGGPNELRTVPAVPVWRRILSQFRDPLIYLLVAAIAISVGAWVVEGATGLPVDAVVIAAVVLFNAALGFIQENKAERAVEALRSMTAANSTVLRNGILTTVPSAELVCGDILVLAEGDSVGADARLITASALAVSEASLTGESQPVYKNQRTWARTCRSPTG
ncbi:probable cation-transporting ATPase F [Arthrobacter sp. Hiyo6]|nr:probable cation-transporting ATPase F [Arthrobacter sp. Hiyo6]